jgi:hypothetical protein
MTLRHSATIYRIPRQEKILAVFLASQLIATALAMRGMKAGALV